METLGTMPETPEGDGPNFAVTRDGALARCRVWSRPDLSSEEGAECARAISSHLARLARDPVVRSVILDVAEAPPAAGPKTLESLAQLFASFEEAAKPIVVVVGDSALRRIQYGRLVFEHAGRHGTVVGDPDKALELARARLRAS
jgi:hypothetical protein